jgi:LysR family transcriptional regulator, glycine cleavage system transcriptional activator
MIAPRRFLPSVTSLLALEAVERLGSATLAAAELSVTHSAISRQLKHLEEQIGVALFQRSGRALTLTPAGRDYADNTRGYLQDLARASLKIRAAGAKASLNLAVLPAFGTHWLIPRLKPFADAHPGVVLNFTTRLEPIDFAREAFDAAIHFGQRDWQGVEYLELMRENVIPAGPRGLLPGGGVTPQALLDLPLLHLESRPGAWEDWFRRRGVAVDRLGGMLFDQFAHLAEAAATGFGLALLPAFLSEAEFQRGRLVPFAETHDLVDAAYYLVWPKGRVVSHPLQRLIDWLGARVVIAAERSAT